MGRRWDGGAGVVVEAVLVVDAPAAFVDEGVVAVAERDQVLRRGLAAVCPRLDVVQVDVLVRAAREAESAGMTLHRVPLRLLAQLVERLPGPVTGVEVGEIAIDPHRASALARDRGRGLARPLQRRSVHRADAGKRGDPLRGVLRLPLALVGQVQPG